MQKSNKQRKRRNENKKRTGQQEPLSIFVNFCLAPSVFLIVIKNIFEKGVIEHLWSWYFFPRNPLGEIELPQRVPTDSEDFEEKHQNVEETNETKK